MSYKVPFIFNPGSSSPTLGIGQTGLPVDKNPYNPSCLDENQNVKNNYRAMADNYAQMYGRKISYWTTGYNLTNHNPLYGEDPTAKYRGPRTLKAIPDMQSYSTFLTKFGIMSDLDMILYIPIPEFQRVWGNVFPLAGDLFVIEDTACDRPLGQSPMVFEVTEKHDSINPTDFMSGHYIWKINAKRMDYSYEPGAPQELNAGGPVDSDSYGKIESTLEEPEITINPSENVDDEARKNFDNPSSSVYGKYY